MNEIRLSKYLTDCGVMSRRAADREITAGTITVNGERAVLGQKIDPETDVPAMQRSALVELLYSLSAELLQKHLCPVRAQISRIRHLCSKSFLYAL